MFFPVPGSGVRRTFRRGSLIASVTESNTRVGDLECPVLLVVRDVRSDSALLTVACTRHFMQHDKSRCEVRVFNATKEIVLRQPPFRTSLPSFEVHALDIAREHLKLGPPETGGIVVAVLKVIGVTSFAFAAVLTVGAVVFIAHQIFTRPWALLESKNPGMIGAWLLPGSGCAALGGWALARIRTIRASRL